MKYQLNLTDRANRDVRAILTYLQSRSRQGANSWYRQLKKTIKRIAESPESFGTALENNEHQEKIRQSIFKTSKGLPYRALFIIRKTNIFVIHVRGSGQDHISTEEMDLPDSE
jgi:plasmid stabilization system protein ParE